MTSVSTEIVTGAFVTKQAKTRRRGAVAGDGGATSPAMDRRVDDGASPAMDRRGAAAAAQALLPACMQHVLGGRNEPRFLKFSLRNDFHAQRHP